MSRIGRQINRLMSTIMGVSLKLIVYAVVLLILVRGTYIAYNFGHEIFYASSVDKEPGKDIEVNIPEGYDAKSTAGLLKNKGLISNELSFVAQSKFFELDIKAGEYILNTSNTSREILEILDDGPKKDKGKKDDK